jgi:hypothetical protein
LHILDLVGELTAAIGALCNEEGEFPLAEFDQRLLLEHAQIIERYILAQAGARAFPGRFRLLGNVAPSGDGTQNQLHEDGHERSRGVDSGHHHPHDHGDTSQSGVSEHHVADPESAREAHRLGRAIIGEHPWEQEHEHGDGHTHADEWDWEPISPAES